MKGVLQYDGTAYHGWQRQSDADTVQESCEKSLSEILQDATGVVAAGRTDAGVHAVGQVIHFEHNSQIASDDLRRAWNARLPDDIWLASLHEAGRDFHARFDAVSRTYRYYIGQGPEAESPFKRRYSWPIRASLDWTRIAAATKTLVGRHDFQNFSKGVTEEDSQCTVYSAEWRASTNGRYLTIRADRFLRHMVRALVGGLVAVGQTRLSVVEMQEALDSTGERPAIANAPPQALFLWQVRY